jgi:hypothetical protein
MIDFSKKYFITDSEKKKLAIVIPIEQYSKFDADAKLDKLKLDLIQRIIQIQDVKVLEKIEKILIEEN